MTTRRLATAAAALALTTGLAACGNKHEPITFGDTEGVYVDVGAMKYQVQDSRQLNPAAIPEDKTFMSGIAAQDSTLAPGEAWFAVFVRVENESSQPQQAATSYEITDTDGNVYRPLSIGTVNPFHYVVAKVPAKSVAPDPNSVAAQTSLNGMELLFKVKYASMQENRPLILKIHSPADFSDISEIDLDV
jgi:hypothetical protein